MVTKKAAVIGYPVKHSLSPAIHNYWIKKYGIDGEYGLLETKPENLEGTLRGLKAYDYAGCNLTVPHKVEAFKYMDRITDAAKIIGAVNTVKVEDSGSLTGTNTDYIGFKDNITEYLSKHHPEHKMEKAVIIGAGGAARAVVAAVVAMNIKQIVVVNRTRDKAKILKNELSSFSMDGKDYSADIIIGNWKDRNELLENADLLVNTTILGMEGQNPLDIDLDYLPDYALVNDIVYRPLQTELLRKAEVRGNKVLDGLGMLLYQAVGGFELWFGVKPEVTDDLRKLVEGNL